MTERPSNLADTIAPDSASATPVSLQLADHMRRRIVEGIWRPGERLPSASELARECGTSVFPVSQALQRLKREGLVVARRGVATYVSPDLSDRRRVLHVMFRLPGADELVSQFRARHPEYKVVSLPYVPVGDECDRLLAGPGAPDLVSFGSETFSHLAIGDRLSELDESVLTGGDEDTLVNVERLCLCRGKRLAVPLALMPFVWLARRSVFEASGVPLPAPDWRGDDMLELLSRLTQDRNGDGVLDQFGYLITGRGYTWGALFRALGGSIESWDALASANSRAAARKLWEAIFRRHVSPPHMAKASGRYGPVMLAAAETARVGIVLADLFTLMECRKRFGDDVVALPSPITPSGRRASMVVATSVGIPKRAVCRDGALKMIRFLRSVDAQRVLYGDRVLLPVRLALWDEVLAERKDWAWLLLQEVSGATSMHRSDTPAEMEEVEDLMGQLVTGLLLPEDFERQIDAKRGVAAPSPSPA